MQQQVHATTLDAAEAVPLSFLASSITGSMSIPVEVDGELTVSSVTESIANRMALPDDVAWALRDDGKGAYLDDTRSIGSQITPGSKVSITPKTHLGAGHVVGG